MRRVTAGNGGGEATIDLGFVVWVWVDVEFVARHWAKLPSDIWIVKSFCEKITDDDDEQEQSYGYVPLVDPEVPSGEIKQEMCLKPTCFDLF